jgi:hypothetical protein
MGTKIAYGTKLAIFDKDCFEKNFNHIMFNH